MFHISAKRMAQPGRRLTVIAVMSVALAAGCAKSPKSVVDQLSVPVPDKFAQESTEGNYPSLPLQWSWVEEEFSSEELGELVTKALEGSYDLKSALARYDMAVANRQIAGANRLPFINGFANATRNKRSSRDEFSALRSSTIDTFNLGFNWNWEIDLWGRLRNEKQSAIAEGEASAADFQGARLSLVGTVVRTWLLLRESIAQEDLALITLTNFENNLEVVLRGYADGIYSAVDVSLIRANVESARSQLEARILATSEARRTLQVLIGEYPDTSINAGEATMPVLNAMVPAGLPSELLNRRPDLIAAERRLAAALENEKIAKKAFLPQIRLTGNYGVNSQELQDLIDPTSVAWTVAEGLTLPIFQGGRIWGTWELRKAQTRLAFSEYGRTALLAFMEVESALQNEQSLQAQAQALNQSAVENERAADLAWKNYERGLDDSVITVLEAQRRSFTTRSQSLQTQRLYLQNRIDLHLALGGSFENIIETESTTPMN